jgi:hypothetical protein
MEAKMTLAAQVHRQQTVKTLLGENFHPSGSSYDDRTRERNAVVQQAALFAGTADLSAVTSKRL